MQPFLRRVTVPVATVWTSPRAPRDVDEPVLRDHPDAAGWAAGLDAADRVDLHGRCETQLLHGDRVLVVGEDGPWSAVRATGQASSADPRGYPGWVRTGHLAAEDPRAGLECVVALPSCLCASRSEGPVRLSFGTRLQVLDADEPVAAVALGQGREGAVPRAALRRLPGGPPDAEDVLASARQLLGLPYLWGGTSAWGLDCSGLVHLVLRSWGVEVPRDAHDQAADVTAVPLDEVGPGDLYFFAAPGAGISHVGFVTRPVSADGRRWMLHAPENGRGVEEGPLASDRRARLVAAGRPPVS